MDIEEARQAKMAELTARAEAEFYGAFTDGEHPPSMVIWSILFGLITNNQPTQAERAQMQSARVAVLNLRQKIQAVKTAQTVEAVQAVTW